jgi:hypothetical protein
MGVTTTAPAHKNIVNYMRKSDLVAQEDFASKIKKHCAQRITKNQKHCAQRNTKNQK